MTIDELNYQEE